jgi:hypothetical protein
MWGMTGVHRRSPANDVIYQPVSPLLAPRTRRFARSPCRSATATPGLAPGVFVLTTMLAARPAVAVAEMGSNRTAFAELWRATRAGHRAGGVLRQGGMPASRFESHVAARSWKGLPNGTNPLSAAAFRIGSFAGSCGGHLHRARHSDGDLSQAGL